MKKMTMVEFRRSAGQAPNDPLLSIEDFAIDGPGAPLPNEAIDRIVDGA